MSSIVDQTHKIFTLDIDLSTLGFIDNAADITTADIATIVDAGKKAILLPFTKEFGLNTSESLVLQDITVNKMKGSPTVASSAVTNAVKIQRVIATAGLDTKKPTITVSVNETVASLVASANNVTLLNARPATTKDLADVAGSLFRGPVGVRDTDIGNGTTTGGALVIYADAANASLSGASLTGKVNITITYKKIPR